MTLDMLREPKNINVIEQAINDINLLQQEKAKKTLCFTSK